MRAILLVMAWLWAGLALAASGPVERVDGLIVHLRTAPQAAVQGAGRRLGPLAARTLQALSVRAGMTLREGRALAVGGHRLRLPLRQTVAEAEQLAAQLRAQPDVLYAEPDYRRYPQRVPNDTSFDKQWYLLDRSVVVGGAGLEPAWNISTGNRAVVAVLDSGTTPHSELQAAWLPGYDFISDNTKARDGNGRDADPTDEGDYTVAGECNTGSNASASTWHGTAVAGVIGAAGHNGAGTTGIDWAARVLSVRVLGACGGDTSDIVDAMLWAAGEHVDGVPDNPNPAQVLNLSLSGEGGCSFTEQVAISRLRAAGKLAVVAAGNDPGLSANMQAPGNCTGVINVAATGRGGGRASYSSVGSSVTLSAPGGDGALTVGGIFTTTNTGQTTVANEGFDDYMGTSFSAPVVSGVIALMRGLNANLSADEVVGILQTTAAPFVDSSCTTALCGAGIVDAATALAEVQMRQTALAPSSWTAAVIASATTQQLFSFSNQADSSQPTLRLGAVGLDGANAGNFTVLADTCSGADLVPGASCSVQVQASGVGLWNGSFSANLVLSHRDTPRRQWRYPLTLNVTGSSIAPPPPPPPARGGGGGGALAPLLWLGLGTLLTTRTRREPPACAGSLPPRRP